MREKVILIFKKALSKWYVKLSISLFIFMAILWVLFANSARIITPFLESYLTKMLDRDVIVEKLCISSDTIVVKAIDDRGNSFFIDGYYSIFRLKSYGEFLLDYNELNITSSGKYSVSPKIITLESTADIFDGKLELQARTRYFKLTKLLIDAKNIAYKDIMNILELPHNSDTKIDLNGDIKIDKYNNIVANVFLKSKTSYLDHLAIKESVESDNNISLKELLADENGDIRDFSIKAKVNYEIEHLGVLDQFVGVNLNSSASGVIDIDGDIENINVNLESNVSNFSITGGVKLSFLELIEVYLKSSNIDLDRLFYTLDLDAPIGGRAVVDFVSNMDNTLLNAEISSGIIYSSNLAKYYGIAQPQNRFDAKANLKIVDNDSIVTIYYKTNQMRMKIEDAFANMLEQF